MTILLAGMLVLYKTYRSRGGDRFKITSIDMLAIGHGIRVCDKAGPVSDQRIYSWRCNGQYKPTTPTQPKLGRSDYDLLEEISDDWQTSKDASDALSTFSDEQLLLELKRRGVSIPTPE